MRIGKHQTIKFGRGKSILSVMPKCVNKLSMTDGAKDIPTALVRALRSAELQPGIFATFSFSPFLNSIEARME
jgi:hypothetical protein